MVVKRLYRTRKRMFFLTVAMSILISSGIYWKFTNKKNCSREIQFHDDGFVRRGGGCEMPILNPFSEELLRIEKMVDDIVCDGLDWVRCYHNRCHVVPEILNKTRDVVCTYWDIQFKTDFENYLGEPTKVYGENYYYLHSSDHVKVSCEGKSIHGLGLMSSRWVGYAAGYRPVEPRNNISKSPNVLLLIFDSTSRLGFIRRMPHSYKVLRDKLNAVFMESYNIRGDGTLYALFPILTGRTENELPGICIKNTTSKVDTSQFIFSLLKNKGYRTAYHEDMVHVGTFQYRCNGFRKSPTDHYLRSLLIERKHSQRWYKAKSKYCFGAAPQFSLMFNYTGEFFDLDSSKFCLTFVSDISHDDFNMISVADHHLADFLIRFKNDGNLENTVVFVMGDHGARFAHLRRTYQGRMEERLPLVAVILPNKFRRQRPEALLNLIENSKTLTSPFDIHTTILDLLGLMEYRNTYKMPETDLERGLSFLKPIPKSRTCLEADIAPYWCACTMWYNVPVSDPMFVRVGRALADYIDKITDEKRDICAKRNLISIEYVIVRGSNQRKTEDFLKNVTRVRLNNEYYMTQIMMSPGTAMYEGAVKYIMKEDRFIVAEKDISRINAYGDEPSCLSATQPHLNKYCHCKNKLKDYVQT